MGSAEKPMTSARIPVNYYGRDPPSILRHSPVFVQIVRMSERKDTPMYWGDFYVNHYS